MIKVSVMYPNSPEAKFDLDYYRDKHLPLIKNRMGAALKYYTIDMGLAGGAPDSPAAFIGMCHLLCDSVASYRESFAPHAAEILADIGNFTDRKPVIQISEVVVENSAQEPQLNLVLPDCGAARARAVGARAPPAMAHTNVGIANTIV